MKFNYQNIIYTRSSEALEPEHIIHLYRFIPNMTGFDLNITGFILIMT